ncbi:MAG: hypothetical protein K2X35_14100 [Bryobacteraceae bacterium]|nr:hypothetical protein [Bryobacteraceae bacterium]
MEEDLIRQAYAAVPRPEPRPFLAGRIAAARKKRRFPRILAAYWIAVLILCASILPLPVTLMLAPAAGLLLALPGLRHTLSCWAIPLLRE